MPHGGLPRRPGPRAAASAYRGITSAIPRQRLGVDLRKIKVRTLFVWGETDGLVPLRAGNKKAAERIPDAELAVVPECGHFADGGVSDRHSEFPEWRIVIVSPVQLS